MTIILSLLVLSILILAHEFGHFLAAKKAGIKVEEFGFGYPPRLFGKKIGETIYSINVIPFGGFVKLYGEELEERKKEKFAFWAKSKKARSAVILAGVFANFLLGIAIFSLVYSFTGIPQKTNKVKIVGISPDSPAQKGGLKVDDVILAVDDEKITNLTEFTKLIQGKKGKEVKLLIKREKDNPCKEKVLGGGGFSCENGNLVFWLIPRETPPEGEGPLGVVVSDVELVRYWWGKTIVLGIWEGLKEAIGWGGLILLSLKKMLGDLFFKGIVPQDVAGPVGVFQVTSQVAKQGILNLLQFTGILSINLAILNVLPFPALDGGRLIFIFYELIFRRRPSAKIEHWVNFLGMVVLIFLILAVTVKDIQRLINGNFPFSSP
ncbi:MAG: M50 family metallopeptidase [Microgenomates group bacterium]